MIAPESYHRSCARATKRDSSKDNYIPNQKLNQREKMSLDGCGRKDILICSALSHSLMMIYKRITSKLTFS